MSDVRRGGSEATVVIRPTTMTRGKLIAAAFLMLPLLGSLAVAAIVVILKLNLFAGHIAGLEAAVAAVLLLLTFFALLFGVGVLNSKARIVLNDGTVRYYGLGGRLKRTFRLEDIGSVVYVPVTNSSTGIVHLVLVLDREGRILLKTSGTKTAWRGDLPKLWELIGKEPLTRIEALSSKQFRQAYPT